PNLTDMLQNAGSIQSTEISTTTLNVLGETTTESLHVTTEATIATLTVTGDASFGGNITLEGQLVSRGETPTLATVSPDIEAELAEVKVEGTDTTGTITIIT